MLREILSSLGYLGVFILVFLLNLAPGFVPPTWIVLLLFYLINPNFNIFLLALVGAIASTLGRFCLLQISKKGKILLSKKEKEEMKFLNKKLKEIKNFGFISSLIVALTPIPSNAYFIMLGFIEYSTLGVFLGFFIGRLITYFLPLFLVKTTILFIRKVFFEEWMFHLFLDTIGIISIVIFILIDWKKILKQKNKIKT
jgi:membrane protein YqaA with SNARE-associated domain